MYDDDPNTHGVPKESWFSPKIEIRQSPLHGKGTFASEALRADEIVEIWGEFSDGRRTVEYTDSASRAQEAKAAGKAVMQWDIDLFSIEERGSDEGYFLNHSCDPNLWFKDAFTLIV